MRSKLICISKNWIRHGEHSGYEVILDYLNCGKINEFFIPHKISFFFKKRTNLVNYQSSAFSKEILAFYRMFFYKKIFILYGDMDFFYLHILKKTKIFRNREVIVAFHHPPKELEIRLKYNRNDVLGKIDKIILMGNNQSDFFRKYSNARLKFIPHGIDTNYFKPNVNVQRDNSVLLIGVSHRDHSLNKKIINAINEKNEDLIFNIVIPNNYKEFYEDLSNVNIITRKISDEELLHFYHSSKAILLMLSDCTASNTILESLATGCPLVVNDVGAVKDYIPSNSGLHIFKSSELNSIVEYLSLICKDVSLSRRISDDQVKLSKRYDWVEVAKKTKKYIEE